ncbi:hypothetical protein JOB18_014343 [Solea senegalensis]|uniref:Uncharacterized protein n=1 Tax=Solea senegalensis TaxID=28829 RepID=A0AAV6Q953_SOLSE|nr:hypothetical protein JOB18_014343 [Solea senegalensis]
MRVKESNRSRRDTCPGYVSPAHSCPLRVEIGKWSLTPPEQCSSLFSMKASHPGTETGVMRSRSCPSSFVSAAERVSLSPERRSEGISESAVKRGGGGGGGGAGSCVPHQRSRERESGGETRPGRERI